MCDRVLRRLGVEPGADPEKTPLHLSRKQRKKEKRAMLGLGCGEPSGGPPGACGLEGQPSDRGRGGFGSGQPSAHGRGQSAAFGRGVPAPRGRGQLSPHVRGGFGRGFGGVGRSFPSSAGCRYPSFLIVITVTISLSSMACPQVKFNNQLCDQSGRIAM